MKEKQFIHRSESFYGININLFQMIDSIYNNEEAKKSANFFNNNKNLLMNLFNNNVNNIFHKKNYPFNPNKKSNLNKKLKEKNIKMNKNVINDNENNGNQEKDHENINNINESKKEKTENENRNKREENIKQNMWIKNFCWYCSLHMLDEILKKNVYKKKIKNNKNNYVYDLIYDENSYFDTSSLMSTPYEFVRFVMSQIDGKNYKIKTNTDIKDKKLKNDDTNYCSHNEKIKNINNYSSSLDSYNSENIDSDNLNDNINSDNINSDNINSDNINSDNINSDYINSDNLNYYNINNNYTNLNLLNKINNKKYKRYLSSTSYKSFKKLYKPKKNEKIKNYNYSYSENQIKKENKKINLANFDKNYSIFLKKKINKIMNKNMDSNKNTKKSISNKSDILTLNKCRNHNNNNNNNNNMLNNVSFSDNEILFKKVSITKNSSSTKYMKNYEIKYKKNVNKKINKLDIEEKKILNYENNILSDNNDYIKNNEKTDDINKEDDSNKNNNESNKNIFSLFDDIQFPNETEEGEMKLKKYQILDNLNDFNYQEKNKNDTYNINNNSNKDKNNEKNSSKTIYDIFFKMKKNDKIKLNDYKDILLDFNYRKYEKLNKKIYNYLNCKNQNNEKNINEEEEKKNKNSKIYQYKSNFNYIKKIYNLNELKNKPFPLCLYNNIKCYSCIKQCVRCYCFYNTLSCYCKQCKETYMITYMNPHYFIFQHGLTAGVYDFQNIINPLLKKIPHLFIYIPYSNQGHTFEGVDIGTKRICTELKYLFKRIEKKINISFVGHSLGGILVRSVLLKLYKKDFFKNKKLINFITFACPHIGVHENITILKILSSYLGAHTIDDLNNKTTTLLKIANLKSINIFKKFENIIFYGNTQSDWLVGIRTSLILPYSLFNEDLILFIIEQAKNFPEIPINIFSIVHLYMRKKKLLFFYFYQDLKNCNYLLHKKKEHKFLDQLLQTIIFSKKLLTYYPENKLNTSIINNEKNDLKSNTTCSDNLNDDEIEKKINVECKNNDNIKKNNENDIDINESCDKFDKNKNMLLDEKYFAKKKYEESEYMITFDEKNDKIKTEDDNIVFKENTLELEKSNISNNTEENINDRKDKSLTTISSESINKIKMCSNVFDENVFKKRTKKYTLETNIKNEKIKSNESNENKLNKIDNTIYLNSNNLNKNNMRSNEHLKINHFNLDNINLNINEEEEKKKKNEYKNFEKIFFDYLTRKIINEKKELDSNLKKKKNSSISTKMFSLKNAIKIIKNYKFLSPQKNNLDNKIESKKENTNEDNKNYKNDINNEKEKKIENINSNDINKQEETKEDDQFENEDYDYSDDTADEYAYIQEFFYCSDDNKEESKKNDSFEINEKFKIEKNYKNETNENENEKEKEKENSEKNELDDIKDNKHDNNTKCEKCKKKIKISDKNKMKINKLLKHITKKDIKHFKKILFNIYSISNEQLIEKFTKNPEFLYYEVILICLNKLPIQRYSIYIPIYTNAHVQIIAHPRISSEDVVIIKHLSEHLIV